MISLLFGTRRWSGLWTAVLPLVLMGLSPMAVQAQTGQITGTVTDAQSGGPMGEVQVFIPASQIGGLTRANGRFLSQDIGGRYCNHHVSCK